MDSKGCTNSNSLIHGNNTFFRASPTDVDKGADIKEIIKVDIKLDEPDIKDYIKLECQKRDLDYRIVYAVIEVESNWQADTIGDNGQSYGLMQIQPKWHQDRMDRLGVTDLLDPKQNVLVGCDLLAELLEQTNGDLDKALTIYNVGHDDGTREYAERVKEQWK